MLTWRKFSKKALSGAKKFLEVYDRLVHLSGDSIVAMLEYVLKATDYVEYLSGKKGEQEDDSVQSNVQELLADAEEKDSLMSDGEGLQQFLEQMVEALPEDVTADDTVTDSSSEAAKTVEKVSSALPEAAELARIEARQLALVERLTRFADSRAARASLAIRKLGLDPAVMLRAAEKDAMGGPLEQLATGRNGEIDPRFERLGLSLARMAALERGLDGIPQVRPAAIDEISSGLDYRRDPFTRSAAMHSGIDFRGPIGAPIYAAADGVVSFVGRKSGYGNVVEISHGNGLLTRYAHMSRFAARVGQRVNAGDHIGGIGNTGRSTGPHLHFEVRINDRAVNPRPFLEMAPNVLEEARRDPAIARSKTGQARGQQ